LASPASRWLEFVDRARRHPELPFDAHRNEYRAIVDERRDAPGPPAVWSPSPEHLRESNIGQVMTELGFETYEELHAWSARNR
jgi:hypothetical protein